MMNNSTKQFERIAKEMTELYGIKNTDYGDSVSLSITEFGYVSGLVRIGDKFNRAKQLLLTAEIQQVKEESVIDTLTDLANYAIMLRMEIENNTNNNK